MKNMYYEVYDYINHYFRRHWYFYTTLYQKDRNFGGEEEGGWWYNNYIYINHTFTPFGIGSYKAEKRLLKDSEDQGGYNGIIYFETRLKQYEDNTKHYYC